MSDKILFVNSCVSRGKSRTMEIAEALLARLGGTIARVDLDGLGLEPLDSRTLSERDATSRAGRLDDGMFGLSREFAEADVIVLASPYWGCSFNAMMKTYLEHVDTVGIIYRYADDGRLIGMCRAKKLYYVTTRGGYTDDEHDLGYQTVRMLAGECGIPECVCISASGLDIVGNDPKKIVSDAVSDLGRRIGGDGSAIE